MKKIKLFLIGSLMILFGLIIYSSSSCSCEATSSNNDTVAPFNLNITDETIGFSRSYYQDGGMTYVILERYNSYESKMINLTKDSLECEYYQSLIKGELKTDKEEERYYHPIVATDDDNQVGFKD